MSPLLLLFGIGIPLLVLWSVGGLAVENRTRLVRTTYLVGLVVALFLLLRLGMPWLAALGTVLLGVIRFAGPLLLRLLPFLALPRQQAPRADDTFRKPKPPQPTQMTRAEALEVLGLDEGAPEATIREAYTELIKKVHPDRGGTSYLAARVNLARDLLLPKEGA